MRDYPTTKRQSIADPTPAPTPATARPLERTCACGRPRLAGGECASCRAQRVALQRAAVTPGPAPAMPPTVAAVVRSPGQPLDRATRLDMERALGRDFSGVRIHADAPAGESARAVNAHAYTVGSHVVFGPGRYAPTDASGRRLLAHELAHTVQQETGLTAGGQTEGDLERQAETVAANAASAGGEPRLDSRLGQSGRGRRSPALQRDDAPVNAKLDEVRQAYGEVQYAGVGNFPKIFKIVDPLPATEVLEIWTDLDARRELEVVEGHLSETGSANRGRLEALILAVFAKGGRITPEQRKRAAPLLSALSQPDAAAVESLLSKHEFTILTKGEAAEVDRLAGLQKDFWEQKRLKEEAEARRQAEEETKKSGKAPPAAAPKVGVEKVLEKEVGSRSLKPLSSVEWDKLSAADKSNWENVRAPAAIQKVKESVKGTELEKVLPGKTIVFNQPRIIDLGAYAFRTGTEMTVGMSWIKDAESDPKNVWANLAHEFGGHFEFGDNYTRGIIDKVLQILPEAERKKYHDDPKARQALYTSFAYAETEIFAALRERRYATPESGQAPTYGGLKPETNIETRLTQLDTGFPKEVSTAILQELKKKVDANPNILPRDKAYFLDQVKKHGYAL